jgi:hypothetical protein
MIARHAEAPPERESTMIAQLLGIVAVRLLKPLCTSRILRAVCSGFAEGVAVVVIIPAEFFLLG